MARGLPAAGVKVRGAFEGKKATLTSRLRSSKDWPIERVNWMLEEVVNGRRMNASLQKGKKKKKKFKL